MTELPVLTMNGKPSPLTDIRVGLITRNNETGQILYRMEASVFENVATIAALSQINAEIVRRCNLHKKLLNLLTCYVASDHDRGDTHNSLYREAVEALKECATNANQ